MSWHFYNLNIRHAHYAALCEGEAKSAARYWLEQRSEAPIFFYDFPLNKIRANDFESSGWSTLHQTQMLGFVSLEVAEQRKILVTIDDGWVWMYEVQGSCFMGERAEISYPAKKNHAAVVEVEHPKAFKIRHLTPKPLHVKDVPLVLSSMKSNQFLVRGTFSQVFPREGGTYKGNAAAIQAMIGEWDGGFDVDPLDCLSSLEFETLIAKMLEEAGCFVPAYKGGYLRDVDLIAQAGASGVRLAGLTIEPNQRLAIQLKMWLYAGDLAAMKAGTVQALVGLNDDPSIRKLNSPTALGRSWVRAALQRSPLTLQWLHTNLAWLPQARQNPPLPPTAAF